MLFHELEDLEKMALVSSEGDIFNVMSGLYTGGVENIQGAVW